MWTKTINVAIQVAEIQVRKSELEDMVFGLKLADGNPKLIEKLEALVELMMGDDL